MKDKNAIGTEKRFLIIGVMLILSSMLAYGATSIELTTGNFINVFGNLNLSGNNLINAGNVSIRGNLSVDGNVSLDGSTLFVDSLSNRVGIGTTSPTLPLHVIGAVNVSTDLNVGDQLIVFGAGPNVVGGAANANTQL